MIRPFPTTLVLGRSDLKDYDKRRRHFKLLEGEIRKASKTEIIQDECARYHLGSHDGGQEVRGAETCLDDGEFKTIQSVPALVLGNSGFSITVEEDQTPTMVHTFFAVSSPPEEEQDCVSIGLGIFPENESHQSLSPSKDDFHYGGFVRSLSKDSVDLQQRSSPFVPDDVSTPQNGSVSGSRRLGAWIPLPRSPLFISQNASSSPEHRPTAGLTPRVASRVATHNTPGIIFSQPARRPPRRNTRNFRHQANSFSFDSSERSSAAYEQRVSSSSTTESTARPAGDLSLHEELRGNPLQGSSAASGASSSSSDVILRDISSLSLQHEIDESTHTRNDFIFSSPQLSEPFLPPPFSAMSRGSSRAEVLPSVSVDSILHHPPTSPIRSSPSSPVSNKFKIEHSTNSSPPEYLQNEPALNTSPITRISSGSLFQRAARVFSAYRSRTPSNLHSSPSHPSPSSSPTPRQSQVRRSSRELNPQTPSRSYRVYNDTLSSTTQPQTPAHLPEARHQSRFHPSYTAPVARPPTMPGSNNTNLYAESRAQRRRGPFVTPSRRRIGRTQSPVGILTGGFQGLYGGRENGDEEQNWAEGIRFNNAEMRLWGLRDARNDGRTMRETPEPDDWRAGNRQ